MKKFKYILMGMLGMAISSCNSYLDTMPDNRAEVDSADKVEKLLVSAYPGTGYLYLSEVASDNTDYQGANNPFFDQLTEDTYFWRDFTEAHNESPKMLWERSYRAIASANQALKSIEELGDGERLQGAKGEALLCRAYNHFILANVFCQHYSVKHADQDLGVHYMIESETTLNPKYSRGTLAETYKHIEEDLVEGLSLINKAKFEVPKYHFNPMAANAFAARFYLYKGEMDKVVTYSSKVLGTNPSALLRDNELLSTFPTKVRGEQFISTNLKANLLLMTNTSAMGWVFGSNTMNSKYCHGSVISDYETLQTRTPWGEFNPENTFVSIEVYSATNVNKVIIPKHARLIEYVDPVAGLGYRRGVYPAFTTDETLLSRAEANVRLGNFDEAITDLNYWIGANYKTFTPVTLESILAWVDSYEYYEPTRPTPLKKLNPDFEIQDGTQEKLLQYVLQVRRYETIHMGLRWFDVKRYGIEISRRLIEGKFIQEVIDSLPKRDLRSAIQLPQEVILAGMEANPR